MLRSIFLVCFLCGASVVSGNELDDVKPLRAEVEFGVVLTSGNTQTRSVNGKGFVQYQQGRWTHTGSVFGFRASDREKTFAERYGITLKSDYHLDDYDYVFGRLRYEDDRFSGYDYQSSETIGVGRRVIRRDDMTMDLELGIGARQNRQTFDGTIDEDIVFGSGDWQWQATDTALVSERVNFESGDSNTRSETETALKLRINGHLSMKVSHRLQHNTAVPTGIAKTDTVTAVTLVIDY